MRRPRSPKTAGTPQNPPWPETRGVPERGGSGAGPMPQPHAPLSLLAQAGIAPRGAAAAVSLSSSGGSTTWHEHERSPAASRRFPGWLQVSRRAPGRAALPIRSLHAGVAKELLEKPPRPDSWRCRQPFAGLRPAPKARLLGARGPREGSIQIKALTGRAVQPVRRGEVGLFPSRPQEGSRLKCRAGDPFAPRSRQHRCLSTSPPRSLRHCSAFPHPSLQTAELLEECASTATTGPGATLARPHPRGFSHLLRPSWQRPKHRERAKLSPDSPSLTPPAAGPGRGWDAPRRLACRWMYPGSIRRREKGGRAERSEAARPVCFAAATPCLQTRRGGSRIPPPPAPAAAVCPRGEGLEVIASVSGAVANSAR